MFYKGLLFSLFGCACLGAPVAPESQSPRAYFKGQLLSMRYLSRGRMTSQAAIERAIKAPHAPHICTSSCCHPNVALQVVSVAPIAPHVCTSSCCHPACLAD
ncbi:MAG: hypothetical protein P4L31_04465 [Candidatus Babeliales bacterium]|nr:hypothetical protein [Candidatus Babeliales bacterium]